MLCMLEHHVRISAASCRELDEHLAFIQKRFREIRCRYTSREDGVSMEVATDCTTTTAKIILPPFPCIHHAVPRAPEAEDRKPRLQAGSRQVIVPFAQGPHLGLCDAL